MEDRHGILEEFQESFPPGAENRSGCSHPAPAPLHSSTQTLIFLLLIANCPSDFPSQIPSSCSALRIPDAEAGACSPPIAPLTPVLPFPRALGKAKPMWGRELQHKRALCSFRRVLRAEILGAISEQRFEEVLM